MTHITAEQINSKDNDGYRRAFTSIARHALPFMSEDSYFSDLLYDAAFASRLPVGGRYYLLVREVGTNYFDDAYEAMQHCGDRSDGRAVLRIMRGTYDTFAVSVIYTRDEGLVDKVSRSDATSDVAKAC